MAEPYYADERHVPAIEEKPEADAESWVTATGQRIPVELMRDDHIVRVVDMMLRNVDALQASHFFNLGWVEPHGEMAQLAAQAELDYIIDRGPLDFLVEEHPTMRRMFAELHHRGIAGRVNVSKLSPIGEPLEVKRATFELWCGECAGDIAQEAEEAIVAGRTIERCKHAGAMVTCDNCRGRACSDCGACRCGGEPGPGWMGCHPDDSFGEYDIFPDRGDH